MKVLTFTRVTGLRARRRARRRGPRPTAGRIACGTVVNAAGAWSQEVAALVGVALPNRPTRHEILVTEPLKPLLDPLVSVLVSGLYFSQSMRGEIVGGMGDPDASRRASTRARRLRFLARFARAGDRLRARLADVKVLRQWAGVRRHPRRQPDPRRAAGSGLPPPAASSATAS